MINLAQILTGKPYLIAQNIYFYQPTIYEIIDMGEGVYWSLINLWTLKRKDMIERETVETQEMDDFELWKAFIFSTPQLRKALILSCANLLKEKVEFFDISGTIYIGEKASGIILDNTFYLLMKEVCSRMTPDTSASEEGQQYRETDTMTERERQLIEKMKKAEKQVDAIKNPNKKPEDYLGNRIVGLVAVGGYTFEQVYNMTMLQFNLLLQKYVEIQTFELRTALSPYMSSDDGQGNKFWLE